MNFQRRLLREPPARAWGRLATWLPCGLSIAPFVFYLLYALAPKAVCGQDDSVDEYKLKTAMLYNLTYFVEWPGPTFPSRRAPTVLCILGQDPFATSLASGASAETNTARPVRVRQLQSDKEFAGCDILYIGSSERKSASRIFSSLNGSSVLTVGEMTQFAARGGMIQFSVEDRHVRFDINLDAASRARIKISSKLLALAQIVKN